MNNYINLIKWENLEKELGVNIKDKHIYLTAVTHRSFLNENPDYQNTSNERLEFLGDAVLQFLTSEYLYKSYPNEPEGKLTNIRASLVNTISLAEESQKLGLGGFLLISKGEEQSGGRNREYILANTFEAVLGAMYLDTGSAEVCRNYLKKRLFYKTEEIIKHKKYRDPKSLLQETAQDKFGVTPTYTVLLEQGPDHNKEFEIEAYINQNIKGRGKGPSKQKAEAAAAEQALNVIQKER